MKKKKLNILDIKFIFAFRIKNIIYDTHTHTRIHTYIKYLFLRKLFALIFIPIIKKQT